MPSGLCSTSRRGLAAGSCGVGQGRSLVHLAGVARGSKGTAWSGWLLSSAGGRLGDWLVGWTPAGALQPSRLVPADWIRWCGDSQ
jgi:hypothetical protein